jgi:hypothetical protein
MDTLISKELQSLVHILKAMNTHFAFGRARLKHQ